MLQKKVTQTVATILGLVFSGMSWAQSADEHQRLAQRIKEIGNGGHIWECTDSRGNLRAHSQLNGQSRMFYDYYEAIRWLQLEPKLSAMVSEGEEKAILEITQRLQKISPSLAKLYQSNLEKFFSSRSFISGVQLADPKTTSPILLPEADPSGEIQCQLKPIGIVRKQAKSLEWPYNVNADVARTLPYVELMHFALHETTTFLVKEELRESFPARYWSSIVMADALEKMSWCERISYIRNLGGKDFVVDNGVFELESAKFGPCRTPSRYMLESGYLVPGQEVKVPSIFGDFTASTQEGYFTEFNFGEAQKNYSASDSDERQTLKIQGPVRPFPFFGLPQTDSYWKINLELTSTPAIKKIRFEALPKSFGGKSSLQFGPLACQILNRDLEFYDNGTLKNCRLAKPYVAKTSQFQISLSEDAFVAVDEGGSLDPILIFESNAYGSVNQYLNATIDLQVNGQSVKLKTPRPVGRESGVGYLANSKMKFQLPDGAKIAIKGRVEVGVNRLGNYFLKAVNLDGANTLETYLSYDSNSKPVAIKLQFSPDPCSWFSSPVQDSEVRFSEDGKVTRGYVAQTTKHKVGETTIELEQGYLYEFPSSARKSAHPVKIGACSNKKLN